MYSGPLICIKNQVETYWEKLGPTSSRKKSCTTTIKCIDKKCIKVKKVCKHVTPIIIRAPRSNCSMKSIAKDVVQNKCCTWEHFCVGNVCSKRNEKCKFVGKKIKTTWHNNCHWKFTSKYHR